MGVAVSTVTITDSEGWKLVLVGEGVVQVQEGEQLRIVPGTAVPTSSNGSFVKQPGNEVIITDSAVSLYAKVKDGVGVGSVAVWKVV